MHPFEKIIWLKDGQPLTNHYQIYQSNHAVISEMTIRLFSDQDQGEYTCLASNGLGTSSKSIQLLALSTTAPTRTTNAKKVTHRRKRPKYSRIHAADSTRSRATESLRMMTISSPGTWSIGSMMVPSRLLFPFRHSRKILLEPFDLQHYDGNDLSPSMIVLNLVAQYCDKRSMFISLR